jgi:hypothetical protein
MHFVSEKFHLLANVIDLLPCGVQFHGDDHGCPLFLCSGPVAFLFFFFRCKKSRRKIKNPPGLRVGWNFSLLL